MSMRKLKNRPAETLVKGSPLSRKLRWIGVCFMLLLPMIGFGQGHGIIQSPHETQRLRDTSGAGMRRSGDTVQSYQPGPALWERPVQDAFENRGVAKIVRLLTRLALVTYCSGIHTTYIHGSQNLDVHDYLGKFVHVRYRYIKVIRNDIRCVRAPCSPSEEVRIVLESIKEIAVSEEEQVHYTTTCVYAP
jgi:hypothetical protein